MGWGRWREDNGVTNYSPTEPESQDLTRERMWHPVSADTTRIKKRGLRMRGQDLDKDSARLAEGSQQPLSSVSEVVDIASK